jgi:NAD(P)-dependent dehydrogenase (short-subunit alcohol dehydrogenase family)
MPDPMLPDLTGTVTLVTGASGGIGGGIAWRFAQAGSAVVLHFHRNQPTELVARIEASGGRTLAVGADLTQGCDDLIDATMHWGGRLDALVNNAGIQPAEPLVSMTAENWREMIETNLTSAVLCTQAAARVMAAGSVTHIASIEATQPAFGHAHYGTAKAALVTHARAAALEYGPQGIRVNTVSPGLIDRPGLAQAWPEGVERWQKAAPLTRLGTPEDVANACVFLASPLARWITGHNLVVDGGVCAHPTW